MQSVGLCALGTVVDQPSAACGGGAEAVGDGNIP